MSGRALRFRRPDKDAAPSGSRLGWLLALLGTVAVGAAILVNPGDARSAAAQN